MALFNRTSGWRELLNASIESVDELGRVLKTDVANLAKVEKTYPMRVNPYYLSLIKKKGGPLWRQAIPSVLELEDDLNQDDPLNEDQQSPVKTIIHRYPDRVIFLVSNKCAMYCRYCMRKRKVGDNDQHFPAGSALIEEGLDYIRKTDTISDVILSGGDPLLLETSEIDYLLNEVFRIPHVEIVRIHTRVPCTLPQRITENLVSVLKKYRPLYINTHFNHPDELTDVAVDACAKLADAGIPLGCQTVLLKGVNDSTETMQLLMKKLVKHRIRPYYLHHPDQIKGTSHFRMPVKKGLDIMTGLRGFNSGLCIPQYMIDLPGGGGKIPLLPDYVWQVNDDMMTVINYEGKMYTYF